MTSQVGKKPTKRGRGRPRKPKFLQPFRKYVKYKGYYVTDTGVVFNEKGFILKPKFIFRKRRVDYVYIDIFKEGKRERMSYHRFIYSAWNQDFNDPDMVITTKGNRFIYAPSNLICITRTEHLKRVAESMMTYQGDEFRELMDLYYSVKDYMSITEFARRAHISDTTMHTYINKDKEAIMQEVKND